MISAFGVEHGYELAKRDPDAKVRLTDRIPGWFNPRRRFARKYPSGSTYQVKTGKLTALQDGRRRNPHELPDISGGIKHPLAVNIFGDKAYLMNGHHRLEAAKKAKLKTVPVTVRTGPYRQWEDT